MSFAALLLPAGCSGKEKQAIGAYRKFAEALAWGRFDEARAMAEGEEVLEVITKIEGEHTQREAQGGRMKGMEISVRNSSVQPDGNVVVNAFWAYGVEQSDKSVPKFVRTQTVWMRQDGSDWKVVKFQDKYDQTQKW